MHGDDGGFRSPVSRSDGARIYVSKSDLVAAALRELIITGDLVPGMALRQRDLAERFGVSATPVREALRRLESEGLVSYDTHRGSAVTDPESGGLREKYEIRAALEGLAARLATPHVTDEDLAELTRYNKRLGDRTLTPSEINDLNRTFHFRLYELARSPLLLSLMRLLWQSFPGGPQLFRPLQESRKDHSDLLAALRSRDATKAQQVTERHVLGAIPHFSPADGSRPSRDQPAAAEPVRGRRRI